MPAKNIVKPYVGDGFYHLYNRGVDKQKIFNEPSDYDVLVFFLKHYLSPREAPFALKRLNEKNFHGEIGLIAYVLMPNHYHFLLRQHSPHGIEHFMRCLWTAYTIYFNKRYERIGPLFQGVYKGVLVESEAQLLHLSRYIHLNPAVTDPIKGGAIPRSIREAASSYPLYLDKQIPAWLKPEVVLSYFKSNNRIGGNDYFSYQSFVEDHTLDKKENLPEINNLVLE